MSNSRELRQNAWYESVMMWFLKKRKKIDARLMSSCDTVSSKWRFLYSQHIPIRQVFFIAQKHAIVCIMKTHQKPHTCWSV